ncbi:unnamed protein product [Cuscuta europaea]|uniref:Uncharacterized protein n=1 Tax=Cuscuta europaea TaxID=41803 RepID=A0A9P1ELS9_CUSEU|nr:unnamed protein product [Cuscuta europaea]
MGRSPCCDKNGVLKKGPWTPEEDLKLIQYIEAHGPGSWRTLPKNAGLQRCGKSCRLRWTNYLRPDIKRGKFSFEEEESIIQLHSVLGNKWSAIAAKLPGRTDNEVKNYWNTHIRKRLLKSGIDPVTHTPRLDLFGLSSSLLNLNLSNALHLQALINPEMLCLLSTLTAAKNEYNPHNLFQNLLESHHFTNDQLLFQKLWQENQAALMNNPTTSTCPMNTAAAATSPVELYNIGHESTIKGAAQCTLTYPQGEYPGNTLPRLEHITSRSHDNTLTFDDHQNTMMQENLVPSNDLFTSPESYGTFGVGLGNDEPLTEM